MFYCPEIVIADYDADLFYLWQGQLLEQPGKEVFSGFRGKEVQVKKVGFARQKQLWGQLGVFVVLFPTIVSGGSPDPRPPTTKLPPFVVAQLPVRKTAEQQGSLAGGMMRTNFGEEARLVMVQPDLSIKVLSEGFHSACDAEISFDALHILFAGKRTQIDHWNIFEMTVDGTNVRQITDNLGDCRSPSYQATLYTLDSPKPWYQLTFVRFENGLLNEYGTGPTTSLYSCKLDGSAVSQLTFNLSSDMDPFIMPDGRVLFASWQRSTLTRGPLGRVALFGINIDGTDCALFSADGDKRIKYMPCITSKGLAVFVEADSVPWDGAGTLGCVSLRRPLHSYRPITSQSDGLFHSPSPLPDGRILVSRRQANGKDTHGVYVLDPSTGKFQMIFDSPDYHDIQAKAVIPRPEPDGRSSVVSEQDPYGKLYCLNVYTSDLKEPEWLPRGTAKKLRVLEGISVTKDTIDSSASTDEPQVTGIPRLAQRRILGEIPVEEDGSFNIEVPANTAIELQTLDSNGMALRTCSWIWVKNHEPRGCIGCHEDAELTPENIFVKALARPSNKLTLPPERRRTVDFRSDVMTIISAKCVACHSKAGSVPYLTPDLSLIARPGGKAYFNRSYESLLAAGEQPNRRKYVDPGTARTSVLVWHIFGRNVSRPWGNSICSREPIIKMPPDGAEALTEDQKRTFVEWIDMGALWDGVPGTDNLPGYKITPESEKSEGKANNTTDNR